MMSEAEDSYYVCTCHSRPDQTNVTSPPSPVFERLRIVESPCMHYLLLRRHRHLLEPTDFCPGRDVADLDRLREGVASLLRCVGLRWE